MRRFFSSIGMRLSQQPVKLVGTFLLALLVLLPGVALVRLNTGNDTLIKPSTSVYKDNQTLENAFGGESIVVMYTTPDMKKFLSVGNLTKLQEFETVMSHTDGVYAVVTPATAVLQMSTNESSVLEGKVGDMGSGLQQMAAKLRGISSSLASSLSGLNGQGIAAGTTTGANPADVLGTLAQGQSQTAGALAKVQQGLDQMGAGYGSLADRLHQIASGLAAIAQELQGGQGLEPGGGASLQQALTQLQQQLQALVKGNPSLASNPSLQSALQQLQSVKQQLGAGTGASAGQMQQMATVLNQSAKGLTEIGQKMVSLNTGLDAIAHNLAKLQGGAIQSEQALSQLQTGLSLQQAKLQQARVQQAALPAKLSELQGGLAQMANQLEQLASGLATVGDHASNLTPSIPQNQSNLNDLLYDDHGKLRSILHNTVVDDHHVVAMVRLNGGLADAGKQSVIQQIDQFTHSTPLTDGTVTVTGKPVLDNALHFAMKDSMKKMIALAVVIMLIVLSLVFQVRWRIIALPMIFVAVAGTLGLMGYVGIPMTMVSMAVFPILIGLGVDYAIQFHNRYVEEMAREDEGQHA